jgi:FlaA1/EpsC-like NDP-sugar epimerase
VRNRFLLGADIVAVAVAAWGAFTFRFGFLFIPERPEFAQFVIAAVLIKVLVFYLTGVYQRYWNYATIWDLLSVVVANFAAAIAFTAFIVVFRMLGQIDSLSRSVLPMDWLLTMALTVGVRASVRIMSESATRKPPSPERPQRRVLIVGAGAAGILMARELDQNRQVGLRPIGFLDDDKTKHGKRISGLTVLGPIQDLEKILQSRSVDDVIVAMPTVSGQVVRSVTEACMRMKVRSRVMPGIYEMLDGQIKVESLRRVDIADLLRRPQVAIRPDGASYLRNRTVVITGAGGSIGSELARQVAVAMPSKLILLGHGENSVFEIWSELQTRHMHVPIHPVIADIRDTDRIFRIFQEVQPDVVFHAAAHKHVPLMENNPEEAITNNVLGSRNVVEAAAAAGTARLVMVSTDKAVAPSSVMGASKRMAEMIVRDAAWRYQRAYVVVRFGNVLGSRGSVVPTFKNQIARGGPVTVTHPEMRRFFMTIPEAVHLLLQAGGMGRGQELFVLDMGEPVALLDLAKDIIRLSGFDESKIPIVFTGLRPGEKLEEALWENDAQVLASELADVRRVIESQPVNRTELQASADRLIAAARQHDSRTILSELKHCIPSACLDPIHEPPVATGPRQVVFTTDGDRQTIAGA